MHDFFTADVKDNFLTSILQDLVEGETPIFLLVVDESYVTLGCVPWSADLGMLIAMWPVFSSILIFW